jgi:hypothetical protein
MQRARHAVIEGAGHRKSCFGGVQKAVDFAPGQTRTPAQRFQGGHVKCVSFGRSTGPPAHRAAFRQRVYERTEPA